MSFRIQWKLGAAQTLRLIPWREAARVDAAVQRFAQTGEGDLEMVLGSRADYRLKTPGFIVLIEVDVETRVIVVWSLNRRRDG